MPTKGKVRTGEVVSNKMQKTVVIAVDALKHHPLYGKTMRKTVRYKAHDEKGECGVGDRVTIVEVRPLSREKRWQVARIVSRKKTA